MEDKELLRFVKSFGMYKHIGTLTEISNTDVILFRDMMTKEVKKKGLKQMKTETRRATAYHNA